VSRFNVAKSANQRIWDFVHQRANLSLLPGTGYYSAPFRGRLFGEDTSAAVAKQLQTRRVDVLWLGANPCVPGSLSHILRPPRGRGDLPGFEMQMKSGLFGSCRWDSSGNCSGDFNPIETPERNWRVYQRLIARIARPKWVAMANVIPWGSKSTEDLIGRLGETNSPLLKRILEFADDLNIEIVKALSPRLMVVPLSLARSRRLCAVRPWGLALSQAIDSKSHTMVLPEGNFMFYTAYCPRGNLDVRAVFLRHPASLRLSGESKKRVVAGVARALDDF
jgi:hypothetical protein